DVDELLRAVGKTREDGVRVDAESLPRPDRRRPRRDAVTRVGVDGRRQLADREGLTGAVEDRAATGGYLDLLALLLRGHRRVGVAVDDLDPRSAHEGDREQADEGQDEERDPTCRQTLALSRMR